MCHKKVSIKLSINNDTSFYTDGQKEEKYKIIEDKNVFQFMYNDLGRSQGFDFGD